MCHMKTATVRQVRHDFGRVLEWVTDGEEVAITKRNKTVARLVPARQKKNARTKMPDIMARLHKVFGGKVIADRTMRQILDDSRGKY
jgi:prevent-host-death family protein